MVIESRQEPAQESTIKYETITRKGVIFHRYGRANTLRLIWELGVENIKSIRNLESGIYYNVHKLWKTSCWK